jgi:hypothetical protein
LPVEWSGHHSTFVDPVPERPSVPPADDRSSEPLVCPQPAADARREDPGGQPPRQRPSQRRLVLPAVLFLLTCVSTFFAGATGWVPDIYLTSDPALYMPSDQPFGFLNDPYFLIGARRAVLAHWQDGLIYMGCILAILMTHEMGHFLMAVAYRVRASLPFFVPLPISPIGTLGAVIAMEGSQANRRQMFDIGLAGPLAGLVVAIPIIWIGARQLDLSAVPAGERAIELPWAMRLLVDHLHPGKYQPAAGVPLSVMNPYFMAGWVGLLVTALNMMPVSQLDGGHVTYTLFGRWAHWVARLFLFLVFVYLAISTIYFDVPPTWLLMALLVQVIGVDHPPTSDDRMPLGWFRTLLGAASLLIPVFCFAPNPFRL